MQILLKHFDNGLSLEKYNDQPDFIASKKQLRTAFIYLVENGNYTYDQLKGIFDTYINEFVSNPQ